MQWKKNEAHAGFVSLLTLLFLLQKWVSLKHLSKCLRFCFFLSKHFFRLSSSYLSEPLPSPRHNWVSLKKEGSLSQSLPRQRMTTGSHIHLRNFFSSSSTSEPLFNLALFLVLRAVHFSPWGISKAFASPPLNKPPLSSTPCTEGADLLLWHNKQNKKTGNVWVVSKGQLSLRILE